MTLRPFLKWAGSKRSLTPELIKRIPKSWNREKDAYYEPFLGGGALFFALQPKNAVLSDCNQELITTYTAIRDDPDRVLTDLHAYQRRYSAMGGGREEFLRVRALNPCELDAGAVAARMIYLNRTCFNGLYRVNKSGKFNVPFGDYANPNICNEENLRACSIALQGVELRCCDFQTTEAHEVPGALWYADPPYVPRSKTANFTAYSADGFQYRDQLQLAVFASYLRNDAGVHTILSQAANESLGEQYKRLGFKVDTIQARRNINSVGDKRGPVGEYIIW